MSPENILSIYEDVAQSWDKTRNKSLFERAWLDRMLAVSPGRKILDLGCGSGRPISTYLADRKAKVTGIDGSAAMIEIFRKHVPEARAHVRDMRTLKMGKRFHAILAWNSFFHLSPDDQRAMFPIFAAHARPKAALMFTTGHRSGTATGSVEGREIYHASLDPVEYEELLQNNGFKVLNFRPEDPECAKHTIWLARFTW